MQYARLIFLSRTRAQTFWVAAKADNGVTAVRAESEWWMGRRSTLSFLGVCVCMCVWLTTKTAWRFYISWDLRVECVPAGLYLEHRALISEKDIYSTSYSCSDNNPKPPGTCTHTRPHARPHAHTHAGTTSTLPHSASLFTVESHHTAARCSLLFLPLCHSALCSHSHYCTAQIPPECCPRSLSRSSPSLSASTRTALTPCPPPSSARNIKRDSTRVSGWPAAKTNPVMWPSGVCPYRFWRKDHFLGFFWPWQMGLDVRRPGNGRFPPQRCLQICMRGVKLLSTFETFLPALMLCSPGE